ncbi:MAG: hypothetical protein K6F89_03125 [Prevotella sp.]|nr:hypothetical protein [Prevotella sp.]
MAATSGFAQDTVSKPVVTDSVIADVEDSVITAEKDSVVDALDSLYNEMLADSMFINEADSAIQESLMNVDAKKSEVIVKQQRDWSQWRPDPKRALWLALVIPGGGQIYNRKYWKLPIVYGGFIGCIYALSWNSMMYKDYQQAYLDIMDDDPNTASYNKFLHLGRTIDSSNIERYKDIFKSRKDRYRRWRDLSFFSMVGIYALSVIDAYVDAELSDFDISKDLSMKVRPTVFGTRANTAHNTFYNTSVGVNCCLNF